MSRVLALTVLLATIVLGLPSPRSVQAAVSNRATEPRRENRGDLTILYLFGSYQEMGRQQATLLGEDARRMFDYHLAKYRRIVASGGIGLRIQDWLIPVLVWLGPIYEESGFFEEIRGIAEGLQVRPADVMRALTATTFGSTVFAATRSATTDGRALIGRNVDWDDGGGIMRPVVYHYHPNNGDFAFVLGGWPLIGAPAIGINEKGFAVSFNFFIVEEQLGLPPQLRDRRALQKATTVQEGLHILTNVRRRATPTFLVMADAAGEIAMIEATPSQYEIFRPEGDWFAQANHARSAKMADLDLYRSPDSFRRRAAMEAAVAPHLGRLDPGLASKILRDRTNSSYVNDDTVANPAVLNAAVIQPGTKTLWHSTSMQPFAPFGEMVPFSVANEVDIGTVAPLPADPSLGSSRMRLEAELVEEARRAVRRFDAKDFRGAHEIWQSLASRSALLHPDRLTWARAIGFVLQADLDSAAALLPAVDRDRAPFEVRTSALALRGWIAAKQGKADIARQAYASALARLDEHPEFRDFQTSATREFVLRGQAVPEQAGELPPLPDLQRIPR